MLYDNVPGQAVDFGHGEHRDRSLAPVRDDEGEVLVEALAVAGNAVSRDYCRAHPYDESARLTRRQSDALHVVQNVLGLPGVGIRPGKIVRAIDLAVDH